jgi:hypothetical protein
VSSSSTPHALVLPVKTNGPARGNKTHFQLTVIISLSHSNLLPLPMHLLSERKGLTLKQKSLDKGKKSLLKLKSNIIQERMVVE